MSTSAGTGATSSEAAQEPTFPCVLVYSTRERARGFARTAFPRRFGHTVVARTVDEFDRAMR
ncbi:MAG: hypothetical protein ACR2M1_14290, partial [Gemmatimonadaceae bacterium]